MRVWVRGAGRKNAHARPDALVPAARRSTAPLVCAACYGSKAHQCQRHGTHAPRVARAQDTPGRGHRVTPPPGTNALTHSTAPAHPRSPVHVVYAAQVHAPLKAVSGRQRLHRQLVVATVHHAGAQRTQVGRRPVRHVRTKACSQRTPRSKRQPPQSEAPVAERINLQAPMPTRHVRASGQPRWCVQIVALRGSLCGPAQGPRLCRLHLRGPAQGSSRAPRFERAPRHPPRCSSRLTTWELEVTGVGTFPPAPPSTRCLPPARRTPTSLQQQVDHLGARCDGRGHRHERAQQLRGVVPLPLGARPRAHLARQRVKRPHLHVHAREHHPN